MLSVMAISDEEKLFTLAKEQICRRFTLAEIKLATLNFDDMLVIGTGGFGMVYKGHIYDNKDSTPRLVAIKRLDSFSRQGASEFMTEIEMLSKLRHCHLVSLIGYCYDSTEMILVYEYMPNGTIEHHLQKADTPLSWMHRLNISIGAARGLDYLHTGVGTQLGVVHRDVKTSNILLDENWAAKIADFGLSKKINQPASGVNTELKGTFGYLDPEYYMTGYLTRKSDVYAFGVVLFELLSGRRAVDTRFSEDEWNLANWAQKCVKERRLDQIVSSHITGHISPKCLKEFALIADRCLRNSRKERPTMAEVVVALQFSMSLQEQFETSLQLAANSLTFTHKMQKLIGFGSRHNSADLETQSSTDNGLLEYTFRVFSYSDMELATRNFSSHMLLGHGHYGEVFRGWLDKTTFAPSLRDTGLTIAVKRLYSYMFKPHKLNMKSLEEFNDPNMVKILGYCVEEDTVLIAYEFMHHGTLNDYLFSFDRVIERRQLISRVKIAIGIARGLVFLQTKPQLGDCSSQMHNIFLDKEFNAKLSDFDVAMLVLNSDPPLHLDPGSFYNSKVKSGVFGLGVILMELLTGKPIENECELTVTRDFLPGEHGVALMQSIRYSLDSRLRFNILLTRPAIQLALLAQKCVVDKSNLRPTIESVLEELEEIYNVMLKFDNSSS